ncbi:molybdenum cofactor guanylyltransferase MobA [Variovorax sp. GT1P44]|uniref:molybdenum cofactor guanylyltransferase MobA n=1 Tax=Variovorax sp. GT1P44 TaxID=3443742 RepID=UPI003F488F62
MIHRDENVTGLVLAGGRGSRMGGVDKGLQTLEGKPLVAHALARLAPQVGALLINANRHLDRYAEFGVPTWPDADADFAGPLAGFLAGLAHCQTDWLVTVPCDTPRFPLDLVARLGAGRGSGRIAVAVTEEDGRRQRQPVFCLMHRSLHEDLADFLAGGGRKIDRWLDQVGCADVYFEEAGAFFNANTIDELRQLGTD